MLKKARAAMANDDVAADGQERKAGGQRRGRGGGKGAGKAQEVSQQILDSSRSIWLAGLGAFSRAQAEGMRVFEGLVKQGETLEAKTRRTAADTAAAATDAARAKVKEMREGVGGTWDKLEQVFEARVARALAKLGVHTQSDVERLAERVDALSAAVNELIKASGAAKAPVGAAPRTRAARKPKATTTDARKPATKRAARRKSTDA